MFWHKWYGKHFKKPGGWLGHWTARVMEKRNQDCYERVIPLLEIGDEDRILEIGFGTGLAIRKITEQNSRCRVLGVDFSRLMLAKATRNNRAALKRNQVRLECGEFGAHEFGAQTFTKIFAINVVYFWDELAPMFLKIHQLLDAGGRLVLYLSSPERLDQVPYAVDGVFNRHTAQEARESLRAAGFERIECQTVVRKGQDTYFFSAWK